MVFATLEVCLCLLVRQLPALNPTVSSAVIQSYAKNAGLSDEASLLISTTVGIMAGLPDLCTPAGTSPPPLPFPFPRSPGKWNLDYRTSALPSELSSPLDGGGPK